MAWRLAPSLVNLRNEVNIRWPNRDKESDGTIGDAAHQASRSDHNPNIREMVDAWDMDKDGVQPWTVIDAFQMHPSAHYWIFNRTIADRDSGWAQKPYTGSNPHDKHVHFSIRQTASAENNQEPWGLLEDEMTVGQFLALLQDPKVAAQLRAIAWQYKGGGIPEGLSTLNVLNSMNTKINLMADMLSKPNPDMAELRAKLEEIDAEETARAEAEVQRDAEFRDLLNRHSSGEMDAEAVVRKMGELLSDKTE